MGEDAEVESEPTTGTSVAPPSMEEAEAAERELAEEEAEEILGDPMAALARYIEEQRLAAEKSGQTEDGSDPESAVPGEGESDEAARAEGMKRLHQIIIDLTGTIRG